MGNYQSSLAKVDFEGAKKHVLSRLENELAESLYYHGIHHTLDVLNSVQVLAKKEGIEGELNALVQTAALYHDTGYIEQYQENEHLAVEIVKRELPDFGFSLEQINTIGSMILTTRDREVPQSLLEMVLCDADYDYLGRDDFHSIANTLLRELNENGYNFNNRQWDKIQINFLEKHIFYTPSARQLRETKKQKHLSEVKSRLSSYE